MATPSIACLGVIGKNNNPLHITIFPSAPAHAGEPAAPLRTPLQFSLILASSLDIFEARATLAKTSSSASASIGLSGGTNSGTLTGDLGLLHAIDERLAVYGFETNTRVRFVAVVDMRGRVNGRLSSVSASSTTSSAAATAGMGLREGEMKPVFRAMQAAYIRLLQNPFYEPDEHSPVTGRGGKKITSRKFAADMGRIGETWSPGMGVS